MGRPPAQSFPSRRTPAVVDVLPRSLPVPCRPRWRVGPVGRHRPRRYRQGCRWRRRRRESERWSRLILAVPIGVGSFARKWRPPLLIGVVVFHDSRLIPSVPVVGRMFPAPGKLPSSPIGRSDPESQLLPPIALVGVSFLLPSSTIPTRKLLPMVHRGGNILIAGGRLPHATIAHRPADGGGIASASRPPSGKIPPSVAASTSSSSPPPLATTTTTAIVNARSSPPPPSSATCVIVPSLSPSRRTEEVAVRRRQ